MKTTTCKIRKATLNDLPQIRAVFIDSVRAFDRTHYTEQQVEKWATAFVKDDHWALKLQQNRFVVAESHLKEISGFAALCSDGQVEMLYVKPEARNAGIASKMIQQLCNIADESWLPCIHAESSLAATPFFEKNGFRVEGVLSRELEGVHFTKIQLVKRLCVA